MGVQPTSNNAAEGGASKTRMRSGPKWLRKHNIWGGGLILYEVSGRPVGTRVVNVRTFTTDYQCSYSARAFVPFYAQRLSATSAMNAAQGIHKGIEQRHRAHLKGGRLAPRART